MTACTPTPDLWLQCATLSTMPASVWLACAVTAIVAALAWRALRRGRRAAPRAARNSRRRSLLLGLLMGACGLERARAQPRAPDAPALASRRPAGALAIVRLHNTSGEAQTAGFVSPMFGQPFAQGDMPRGSFPQFSLLDGTACPATLWGITSWPDGSMKFCAVMLQISSAIGRRDVLSVQVRGGGTPAPKSRRTTAELQAAALRIELTGVSGLEGTWNAALNDGISEASQLVLLGDGAAGAVWRVGTEFRDAGGRAHGQLYAWHYIAALNDGDGRLLGLRYLGRVAQPWADVTSPPARYRDVAARLHAGERTVRVLQGHTDNETPGPTIRLPHFASFFTAGEDARWDYVQAGGSAAADATVRVSLDVAYLLQSQLVPPYDLRTFVRPTKELRYVPMGRGSVERGMGNTGERPDIGVLPDWNVRHLLTQAASDEQVARVNAMVAGGWRFTTRKRSTVQPVPCVDNRPSYAGLGPTQTSWRGPRYPQGVVAPAPNNSLWSEDIAHRPGCTYWPYLFSGEPQYLDLLVEHACTHLLELAPGHTNIATEAPVTKVLFETWRGDRDTRIGAGGSVHKGGGLLFMGGGLRIAAWASRDVAQAAALCPDVAPDGAAVRDYLREALAGAYAAVAEYDKKMPKGFTQAGLFIMAEGTDAPWMRSYLSWSLCHQADILASREAVATRQYFSRFWRAYAEIADITGLTAYSCSLWNGAQMARGIEDVVCMREETLDFDAAGSRGTIVGNDKAKTRPWSPSDGDVFTFGTPATSPLLPFPKAIPNQRLYAVNCVGHTFQLALTPGGKPESIPKDITIPSYMCRARDLSPAWQSAATPYHYPANLRGAVAYHLLRGDPLQKAKAGLDQLVRSQDTRFDDRPKYNVI